MSRRRVLRPLLLVVALVAPIALVGPPAHAAKGTSLKLSSSISSPLEYGGEGQFKARLKPTTGKKKLGNRPVTLWGRPVGTDTWEKVASSRTMSSGLAVLVVPDMTSSTELEARFKGGSGYAPSRSAPIVQEVRAPLSDVSHSPDPVFSGDVVTARATTAGELAGSPVVVERYQGTAWSEVGRGAVGPGGSIAVSFPAGDPQRGGGDTYLQHFHRLRTLDGALASAETSFTITPRPWGLGDYTILRSVGEQTRTQLEVDGGTAPFVFEVVGGSLAPGLSLSRGGLLSGTPTTKGGYTATVRVTDGAGRVDTGEVFLHASGNDIVITTSAFPGAVVGRYYETNVEIRGAVGAPDFQIEGLPEGVSYARDGTVWGVPEETGDFSVRVHVYDEGDNYSTKDIPLRVSGG